MKVGFARLLGLGAIVMTVASVGAGERDSGAVVRRMVDAVNSRDFAALDSVVAADVERHSAATPGVEVHSLEQFKAFLRHDLEAVPDARQEIRQLLVDGDMVAVRAVYSGTQTGQMGPFPPSGRRLELPFMAILRVTDGRVAEMWVEWDNLAALAQLGYWPPHQAEGGADTAALEARKVVARRWFEEVINGRNLDAIPDIYAADYVHHGLGGADIRGLDTVRSFAAAILAASADRHAVVERQVAEGDRVVTQFTSRGTRSGAFQGVPPNGEPWITRGIVISRIEDGKVAEDWEIVNSSGVADP